MSLRIFYNNAKNGDTAHLSPIVSYKSPLFNNYRPSYWSPKFINSPSSLYLIFITTSTSLFRHNRIKKRWFYQFVLNDELQKFAWTSTRRDWTSTRLDEKNYETRKPNANRVFPEDHQTRIIRFYTIETTFGHSPFLHALLQRPYPPPPPITSASNFHPPTSSPWVRQVIVTYRIRRGQNICASLCDGQRNYQQKFIADERKE